VTQIDKIYNALLDKFVNNDEYPSITGIAIHADGISVIGTSMAKLAPIPSFVGDIQIHRVIETNWRDKSI